ncbi:MAG: ABC transporter permease [Ignavibacteriales bacterium]|nr:ABC transporter permease [Ignavibacteriaceae bacterium]QOJ29020.1 MAG: ABC transporter permease [Ignavibacteriales bacterium]
MTGFMVSYFKRKGDGLFETFRYIFEVFSDLVTFRKQTQISAIVFFRQILFTGFDALSIIVLIAAAIGGIMVIEGNSVLPGFTQSKIFYNILISIVFRELSCLLTAFIIVARSGTAISTELGNMTINHEIEALLSFGVSPITYLVVPRVLGVVAAMVILSIYFNVAAVLSCWALSSMFVPVSLDDFLMYVFAELSITDLISGVVKSVVFGLVISLISTYQGLQVKIATTEVPQRTIKAVVLSLTWIIILDVLLTILFFFTV